MKEPIEPHMEPVICHNCGSEDYPERDEDVSPVCLECGYRINSHEPTIRTRRNWITEKTETLKFTNLQSDERAN